MRGQAHQALNFSPLYPNLLPQPVIVDKFSEASMTWIKRMFVAFMAKCPSLNYHRLEPDIQSRYDERGFHYCRVALLRIVISIVSVNQHLSYLGN